MSFLVIGLIVLGVAVVIFLLYGYSLPGKWIVQAQMEIPAEQEKLHVYLCTIRNWEEWTIWNSEGNSQFKFSYEGPSMGPGATQNWKAGRQMGRIQIRNCESPERIAFLFSFGHGHHVMEGHLDLKPRGRSTEVTWTAKGDAGKVPAKKIMAKMLMSYMQKDFQRSLERLKDVMSRPLGQA